MKALLAGLLLFAAVTANAAVCVYQVGASTWVTGYPANPPCSSADQQIVASQTEFKQDTWTYDSELMKVGFLGAVSCWGTGLGVGLVISMIRKTRN